MNSLPTTHYSQAVYPGDFGTESGPTPLGAWQGGRESSGVLKKKTHFPQTIYDSYPSTLRNVGFSKKNLNPEHGLSSSCVPSVGSGPWEAGDPTGGHVLCQTPPAWAVLTATLRSQVGKPRHRGEATCSGRAVRAQRRPRGVAALQEPRLLGEGMHQQTSENVAWQRGT